MPLSSGVLLEPHSARCPTCACQESHPYSVTRAFRGERRRGEDGVMALRFLYLFFLRVTQLVRLANRDREVLAVEVVVLRHEVAVCAAR